MNRIIFFDGVCHLCNGFVDFLLRHDPVEHFLYAPLQGRHARDVLPLEVVESLRSVVYLRDGVVLQQSDAVIAILVDLGGVWRACKILRFFPRSLRDFVYDVVAKNRYKIFGKRETCRLPTAAERRRFLE